MNRKGFAVSGILYTILLIFLAIIYMLLMNFKNKKNLLDQLKSEVLFNSKLCEEKVGQTFTFDYTGDEQEFIAPCNGYYKLEVWGAQGGSASTNIGGYGGYSVGTINLNSKDIIFLNVGGAGTDSGPVSPGNYIVTKGGYNGGGDSIVSPRSGEIISIGSGGGATSISKKSGQLKDLEVYKGTLKNNSYYESNDIIIVAGGGGGAGFYTSSINGKGGHAGGFNGVNGYTTNGVYGTGGTQIAPGYETGYSSTPVAIGSFGQGAATGCDANNLCWGGTGGGGFFGGGGTIAWHYTNGGGGGSGYIANPNLTNKSMYCYNCTTSNDVATKTESTTCTNATAIANCSKEGNGYAKITYLGDICAEGTEYTFNYTGDIQTFTTSCAGKYKLEVWGAQGGRGYYNDSCYIDDAGYGGYSVGTVNLDDNQNLYIAVGEKPSSVTGGYNGGGTGLSTDNGAELERSSGGGGATHIALDSGVLSSLSTHANDGRILIVAGGGGGSGTYRRPDGTCGQHGVGGYGGGITGTTGTKLEDSTTTYSGSGASQASFGYSLQSSSQGKGAFGKGGSYHHTCCGGSGGGGGYYGGGGSNRPEWGAGGGSGYIASSNLLSSSGITKAMYCYNCTESNDAATFTISTTGSSSERNIISCPNGYDSNPISKCAKAGNGYAKITYLGNN